MKILYIDLDKTVFDYDKQHKLYSEVYEDVKYVQGLPNFFETLEPLPYAIESVKLLMNHYEVYILTAPSYMNPLSYTGKRISVETHFGLNFCRNLILCHNKSLMRGDFLIDDNISGNGQENFIGELIQFKNNWQDITNYLIEKLNEKDTRHD